MVDVGEKPVTTREAVARAWVRMAPQTLEAILCGGIAKGEVLQVARIAGIMAAKRTPELIPLCHSVPLDSVSVRFAALDTAASEGARLYVEATARCRGKTGVEMEALIAASVAALTIYDMAKAIDRGMVIEGTHVALKRGGRSGSFEHPEAPGQPVPDDGDWI